MFRDVYKKAHKEITPDEALLQNILAMAENESNLKKKQKTLHFYPYVSVAAAVFFIAVSSVIYVNLSPKQTGTENSANIIAENIEKKEAKEEKQPENNDSAQFFSKKAYDETSNSGNKPEAFNEALDSTEKESAKKLSEKKDTRVMMNINKISQNLDTMARSGAALAEFSADEQTSESIFEYWSESEYSAYTGFDISSDISVPEDMVLFHNEDFLIEKDSETNEIINDENSYYFEKDYQRFIIVATSKNKKEAKSFLDETKYQITNVNDNRVTITYDENLYNAYLIKADLAIKITAGGISEEELEKTIISITERN